MDEGTRDDDATNVLARILKSRFEETFAKFCADIPQILRSIPSAGGRSGPDVDGPEFVRVLLEWIAGASTRGQGSRYLLMWYAKTIAEKGSHRLPDCHAIAELIRARLSRKDVAAIDQALAMGWDSLDEGGSLKTLAARQRKLFVASLAPGQRQRFARYLAAIRRDTAADRAGRGRAERRRGRRELDARAPCEVRCRRRARRPPAPGSRAPPSSWRCRCSPP